MIPDKSKHENFLPQEISNYKPSTYFLFYFFLILLFTVSATQSAPRILVLHSYHITDWTDEIQSGIENGLKQFDSIEYYIEYMDTKRFNTKSYLEHLYQIYSLKYSSTKFDLILTVDNNAFDFIKEHRDSLFKGVPVVFCGVNGFEPKMLDGYDNITGVVEHVDFAQTAEIAFKACPNYDTVYLVCDNTETGLINKQELLKSASFQKHKFPIVMLQNISYNDLSKRLQLINRNNIIFFISFWTDSKGSTVTPQNLGKAFAKSNAPIFGRSDWMVNRGMVGGKCAIGYAQGIKASEIASRILIGEPISKLPVYTDDSDKFIFNYQLLKNYKIPTKILPKDAIIINKSFPINMPSEVILLLFIIFILLLISIVLLIIYNKMKTKSITKLKESNEKYRELVEGTDLLVMKLNCKRIITFANKKAEQFLGCSSYECIGKSLLEFIHQDDKEDTHKKVTEILTKKAPTTVLENRIVHNSSGQIFHFLWTITPLFDLSGNLIGLNTIGRDISSYKEIQDQLQHANKMKAIGTLAGGIAHDFNNLLAGILGYTEVALLELPKEHETYDKITEIKKICLRARDLTRQILTFSRQTPFEPCPIQINGVIKEVLPLLRATIPSTIEIRAQLQNVGIILADQTRIHQIVMNLCTNAFHAMETSGGTLTIEVSQLTILENNEMEILPGTYVKLSIEDTGTGIPYDLQNHIFDPFFTTKKVNKGTGLGLSVVHGIVTELKSYIRFKSVPGKGSCFTIYFPLLNEKSEEKPTNVESNQLNGTERIIIVDDEEVVAGSLNGLLKKYGYHTTVFTSSKSLLSMITAGKINGDLLITDMTMPDYTGIELSREIVKVNPDLPIILCTGYTEKKESEISIPSIKSLLIKPIDMIQLLKTIRSILDKKTAELSQINNKLI